MKRITWVGFFLVATVAVGCRSGRAMLPASQAAGNGETQGQSEQARAAQSAVEWVTVRDMREQAFSIQVPKGWKIQGGMFRYRFAYPRPTVEMTSPNGKTNVRVGDATIPNYQTRAQFRMPEGQTGPPVAPYATGDVFAGKYGLARFKSMCQSLELKSSEPKEPKFSKSNGYAQSTAGAATFSCSLDGEPMTGYVYAETMLVKGVAWQPSTWYVMALGSYLAPAAQAQAAGAILQHSGESIAMNPEWTLWQKQIVAAGTLINLHTAADNARATEEMNERQEKWKKMMAGETDDFNDILTGQTFTVDPTTGKQYEVPTGPGGQKWMDSQYNVVSGAMQPGPEYHPLETISH